MSYERAVQVFQYRLARNAKHKPPDPASGIEVTKYEAEGETHIDALNVSCTIYPDSPVHEAEQVAQLKRAMEAVVAAGR